MYSKDERAEMPTSYKDGDVPVGKTYGMPDHMVMALSLAAKRGHGVPLGAGRIGELAQNALLTQTGKRAARPVAPTPAPGGQRS